MKHARNALVCYSALLFLLATFMAGESAARHIEECIYLVPVGKVDEKVLDNLKSRVPQCLPMSSKAKIDPARELPESGYDSSRRQYNAQVFLDEVSQHVVFTPSNERAILITEADLYLPETDYVYGLADQKRGVALISLARLDNQFYSLKPDKTILCERALKEALNKLGRSWKLGGCLRPKCVMFESKSISDTDKKRSVFCYKCGIGLDTRHSSGGLIGSKLNKK